MKPLEVLLVVSSPYISLRRTYGSSMVLKALSLSLSVHPLALEVFTD